MADKALLKSMLQNFINSNPEQAEIDFHKWVGDKFHDVSGVSREEKEEPVVEIEEEE